MTPRLVIFDVDGTLVDSQGDIVASMTAAFDAVELTLPSRAELLAIVGLSLDQAMHRLAPETPVATRDRLVAAYKEEYQRLRKAGGAESSPLYPGIGAVVESLSTQDHTLLGIATGKSRRGLDALLDNHGWTGLFQTVQVADDHPSKPHPSMLMTALAETGVDAARGLSRPRGADRRPRHGHRRRGPARRDRPGDRKLTGGRNERLETQAVLENHCRDRG